MEVRVSIEPMNLWSRDFNTSCSFHLRENSVDIFMEKEDAEMIDDLQAFFHYPSYRPARRSVWTVYLYRDTAADMFLTGKSEKINMELGETGKLIVTGKYTVIESDATKGIVVIDSKSKVVSIYNPRYKVRFIDAYRVVRQLFATQLLEHSIPFHGGAVHLEGINIAFLGHKGFGKSTLVTGLLYKNPTSSYICNDRFFLKVLPGHPAEIVQWPECPALTYTTLCMFEELPDRIEYMKHHPGRFVPSERFIDHPRLPGKQEIISNRTDEGKVIFTNLEFTSMLRRSIMPSTSLDYIFLLSRPENNECELVPISDTETMQLLNKNIDAFDSFPDWLNIQGKRNHNIDLSAVRDFPQCFLFRRTYNLEYDLAFLKEWALDRFLDKK